MAYTETYVSSAGGGAHDGSSPENAWTLEEAIAAAPASGTRVNILTGTHTLTADRTLPSGASEAQIAWQGYASSPGDLESQGRSAATGALTDTNVPVIDCGTSYQIIIGSYDRLVNLKVIGSRASSVGLLYNNGQGSTCWRVIVSNSGNSGNNATYVGNLHYGSATDCDFVSASAQSTLKAVSAGRGTLSGCRIWCSGTPHASSIGVAADTFGSVVERCIIYNFGTGVTLGTNSSNISFNSFYNLGTGIRLGASGSLVFANVFDTVSGYLFSGTTAGNPQLIANASTTPGSGRLDTTNIGSVIAENGSISLTGSPYTNAASGDFTLNNTAGAGAACRGASPYFGGYGDLGAVQHQQTGGSGIILNPGFGGGFNG